MKLKSEELREIMDKLNFDKILNESYIEVSQQFKPAAVSGKFKVYFYSEYMKNNSDKEFVKISEDQKRYLIKFFQQEYNINILREDIFIEGKYIVILFTISKKTDLKVLAPIFNNILKVRFNGKIFISNSQIK